MNEDLRLLGERIAETAAHIDAACHRLLTDLREFDAKGGYYQAGAKTCAHWMSWRIGCEITTAREHVRVARALGELPLIDESLRRGEMSYSKVRAMTRVATPKNERLLLADAYLLCGQQLEKVCRLYKMVQRHDDRNSPEDDVEYRRYVRKRDQANGMVRIEAVLHPDEAALVWAVLDRAAKDMANGVGPDEVTGLDVSPETSAATRAGRVRNGSLGTSAIDRSASAEASTSPRTGARDASARVGAGRNVSAEAFPKSAANDSATMVTAGAFTKSATNNSATMVDASVQMSPTDDPNASAEASAGPSGRSNRSPASTALVVANRNAPAGTPKPERARFDRADALVSIAQRFASGNRPNTTPIEVVITIPAPALPLDAEPSIENAGCLPDGECIQGETARRLACDAGLVMMIEDESGQTLSVGRRTRAIPTAIKRALLKRDTCCRFPGCDNRVYVEGHHIRHWVDGGETALANLVTLCSRHHRFLHEYKYRIELDAHGEPVFLDPRGRPAKDVPPRVLIDDPWEAILGRNADLGITPETNEPGWDGRPVPYNDIVGFLSDVDHDHIALDRYYQDSVKVIGR